MIRFVSNIENRGFLRHSDTMTLTRVLLLTMFFISSNGQVEKLTPEQDVKCGEKCEYPQSCEDCFQDIANVILAGKYLYHSHSLFLGDLNVF